MGWGYVEVYFGWVGVGGHFLWMDRNGWGWVEVYFQWVGVSGHLLWSGGGGWRYIVDGWGCVDIFVG